jgi:putative restriction endonuclease
MGYHLETGVFAGFDLAHHSTFTAGSPSVQIDISAIYRAREEGLAIFRKSNNEIAVGVRPDLFLDYVQCQAEIHQHAADEIVMPLVERAIREDTITDADLGDLPAERARVVSTVSRFSRSARFRNSVMNAYAGRCAILGHQLRLVEAAHILPVSAEGSTDSVTNGIALSPTFHKAFDNGLIYLEPDINFRLNGNKSDELVRQGLGEGLDEMRRQISGNLCLPLNHDQRPSSDFIVQANRYRRIPGY